MLALRSNDDEFPRDYQLALFRDPCVYCGEQATGLDHIVPRSSYRPAPNSQRYRRWLNSWENRAPACARCDGYKSTMSLLIFISVINVLGLPPTTPHQREMQVKKRRVLRGRRT